MTNLDHYNIGLYWQYLTYLDHYVLGHNRRDFHLFWHAKY